MSILKLVLNSFLFNKNKTESVMTNEELIFKTERAVKSERRSTSEVVRLFQEISKRKLFLERGFANLYEMATKHFGYCAGSAMRRINAMRLVQAVPGVETKLESGELSLSVASEVQSFFYSEAKLERPYSLNAKIELIETCLNKSRRDVERELVSRNPEREKRDVITQISSDRVRVIFSISEELNQKLTRLIELLSHTNPSTEDMLDRLAELGLDKFDPERKAARARARDQAKKSVSDLEAESPHLNPIPNPIPTLIPTPNTNLTPVKAVNQDSQIEAEQEFSQISPQPPPPAAGRSHQTTLEISKSFEEFVFPRPKPQTTKGLEEFASMRQTQSPSTSVQAAAKSTPILVAKRRSRYISACERHAMIDHDKGCAYIDGQTGRRCGEKKFLERDHIDPYSEGGANMSENLRWLCSAHNKWSYVNRRSRMNISE
jgi:hypothetical protein